MQGKKGRISTAILASLALFAQAQRGATPYNEGLPFGGTVHALIIGISDYQYVQDLRFADRDARAFREYLLRYSRPAADSLHIELFVNDKATRIPVCDAISSLVRRVQPGDRVYFYFAGHGDIEDLTQSENGLLLLHDSPTEGYFGMTDGVLQVNQIADYFGKLASKGVEVFYVIDACHSGKLRGGDPGRAHTSVAVQRVLATHATLMLSCDADQLSLESEGWGGGRGLFSWYLEDGLLGLAEVDSDDQVSLLELEQYVKRNTYLTSEKRQTPVFLGKQDRILNWVDEHHRDSIARMRRESYPAYTEVNYKGSERRYLDAMDSAGRALYLLCDQRTEQGSLIDRDQDNACQLFRRFLQHYPNNYLGALLRRKLVSRLNQPFDSIVRPVMLGKRPRLSANQLKRAAASLDSCIALLDASHYMFRHFLSRRHCLEAVEKALPVDINNYGPLEREAMHYALDQLHRSRSLEPNASYVYFWLGLYHQTMHSPDSALVYFNEFLRLIPNSALAHNLIGISLGDNRQYEASVKAFERALVLDPQAFEPRNNLAYIFNEMRAFERAEAAARDAIALKPNSVFARNSLASVLLEMHRYEEALQVVEEALQLDSSSFRTIYLKGRIHFANRNFRQAEQLFAEVLRRKRDYGYAARELALSYMATSQWKQALETFRSYFELDPSSGIMHEQYARCFAQMGSKDSAELYFHRALKELSADRNRLENQADIHHYGLGDARTARTYYDAALEQRDNNPMLWAKAASNAVALGDRDRAAFCFDKIKTIPHSDAALAYAEACLIATGTPTMDPQDKLRTAFGMDHSLVWLAQSEPAFAAWKNSAAFTGLVHEFHPPAR
ncbi:MAG: caspase family protein [Saprospiraceae bacterium]|nr:caspase family protein [Saprospiraceae bacterium]